MLPEMRGRDADARRVPEREILLTCKLHARPRPYPRPLLLVSGNDLLRFRVHVRTLVYYTLVCSTPGVEHLEWGE